MYINNFKIFIFILLIITLIIIILTKQNEHFNPIQLNDYDNFKNTLKTYKKKKFVLIFTAGPTLAEFKKTDIPNHVWEDCYVIAVKNAINYLDKLNIRPDFLVTNFCGASARINIDLIDKYKPLFIGLNYHEEPLEKLKSKVNLLVEIDSSKNLMENVKNNEKEIIFFNNNNILTTGWGHIVMELAIPLSLELKPQNIITIGWDVKNVNKYWDVEHFTNWAESDTIINNFTVYLHKYLLDNYNIKIYKLNTKSTIKIPLIDFSIPNY